MPSKHPSSYPITKVYIVSDPQKCSVLDELLLRSKDKDQDCDLLKEGNVFKKNTRYMCFSRDFKKESTDNMVIVSLLLISERETPPDGFVAIEHTADTGEKATKKKLLCYKMADRNSVKEAISDIRLYNKLRRPENGFCAVGELNGIFICTKLSDVPLETQAFKHNNIINRPAPPAPHSSRIPQPLAISKTDYATLNPLSSIAFRLANPGSDQNQNGSRISYTFKSFHDIENEFDYNFSLERSLLGK